MKSKKGKRSAAAVVGATPSVLEPTPLSDIPFHGGTRQQRRAVAQDDLVSGDTRMKQPATIKVVNFHKVPPRSQIVEKENVQDDTDTTTIRFKERSCLEEAPGLGEISATIWAKTSASKGGAKDPAAIAISRAVHIAEKKAQLDDGDERAALLNCDGFKAYAAELIWGVRAPGEADDAPLDQDDPLQVRGRLREVWRSWRKLPQDKQREWANAKLSQEMAAVMRQATVGKVTTSTAEPANRSRKGGSKTSDGWRYAAPPKHTSRSSKATADSELLRLAEQQEQDQQPATGKAQKKRKAAAEKAADQEAAADRVYDPVIIDEATLDDEYRRAVSLRGSMSALLAEMRCWEAEDEEQEAAAAAGMTVDEYHKHRKEAAAATGAADQQETAAAAEEEELTKRGKKRKAADRGAKKNTAKSGAVRRSNRTTRRPQEGQFNDEEMADDGYEDDADLERQEAELEKALAAADDSDEDNEADSSKGLDDDDEEEQPEPVPPTKKAKMAKKAASKVASAHKKGLGKPGKKNTQAKKASREKPAKGNSALAQSDISKKSSKSSKQVKAAETRKALASAEPQKDKAGTSAAAAASADTNKPRSNSTTAKAAQSPSRKSQRHQEEAQQEQQQVDDDNGPAVSGAGQASGPRRGRSAGGAQAAQMEYLEKQIFSNTRNTRRYSHGRADSPGLAALATGAKRSSRLGKNKN